ncbi:MAG: FAD-dependent oxidoreductase [Micromonosporaceae bacterium]
MTEPLAETPDTVGAYPRLSEQQIADLAEYGERRSTVRGDVLFQEGDTESVFFVVLAGHVAVVDGYQTDQERLISVHGPGRFLGELGLFTGQPTFVTAVVREPGEVLAVPVQRLRTLVTQVPSLGDLILRACLIRRSILIGLGTGMRIIGSRYSPDTRRLRDFVARNRLPYRWIDLERDRWAERMLRDLGVTPQDTPVVVCSSGKVLRNPSNAELARAVGLPVPAAPPESSDLIVVGAGPAGLATAVYAASEGLSTVVLDAIATGGQAGTSPRIENYLGFPAGISGAELAELAAIQAAKFGAKMAVPAEATGLVEDSGRHQVRLDNGTTLTTRTVVVATGVKYRQLEVPGLTEYAGGSVYYAATLAEAQLCRGDPVAIVGGGNSAGQAAVFLAQYAPQVHLLVRSGDLGKDMSRYLVDQVWRHPAIRVMTHTEVREPIGTGEGLYALVVEDNRTGERREIPARALFVFIGAAPRTGWLAEALALDERGYVRTGTDAQSPDHRPDWLPLMLETSRPGVFAAGDVRRGSVKRVASAVGEGAMAVRMVHERMG